MAWLELHQELPRHPKVAKFSYTFRINRHEAVGVLCEVWLWCLSYAPSGDLTDIESRFLEDAIGCRRRGLIPALISSGLCDEFDGRIMLHDWDHYAGRLVASRARKREAERTRYAGSLPAERRQTVDSLPPTLQNTTLPTEQNTNTEGAPPSAKATRAPGIDDQFIDAMVAEFGHLLGGRTGILEHIEDAKGHKNWDGWKDKRRGARKWLKRETERLPARNGFSPRAPTVRTSEDVEIDKAITDGLRSGRIRDGEPIKLGDILKRSQGGGA